MQSCVRWAVGREWKGRGGSFPSRSWPWPLSRVADTTIGSRSDLTNAQWERLEPLLPMNNGRCGRWRDHRQVVNGVLFRIRTGVQWRDLPERYGPWKTVHERHRRWSADGTREMLFRRIQAKADVAGEIDWDISGRLDIPARAPPRRQRPPPKGAAPGRSKPLGSERD
ncbi:IS5 family transposase [Streptomyces sp. NPDC054932]